MLRSLAFRLFITLRALSAPVSFGVSGAVYDAQGRVLLIRQSYTKGWRLPGGGVDRGEPAPAAILRELAEEVGLVGGTARFFALYTRKAGWVTAVVALYSIDGAAVNFTPNLEIRDACFADPHAPPPGCTPATLRRLQELTGAMPPSQYW